MSRIGNKPVQIPAGVEVAVNGNNVVVKGPKGQLELDGRFSKTCIRARAWGVGFDEARHAEQVRREPRRKTGCKHRVSRSYRYACALKILN